MPVAKVPVNRIRFASQVVNTVMSMLAPNLSQTDYTEISDNENDDKWGILSHSEAQG